MSKTRHVLKTTLENLIGDAELVLRRVEAGEVPSYDLEGTFRVNCEVAMKKLGELRTEQES